jgi:hypothetical protein
VRRYSEDNKPVLCLEESYVPCPISLRVCGSQDSDKGPRTPCIKRQGFMHALLMEKAETPEGNYDNLMKSENF